MKADGLLCRVQTDWEPFSLKKESDGFLLIGLIIQLCVLLMQNASVCVAGDVCECSSELRRLESGVPPPGVPTWRACGGLDRKQPSVLFLEEQMSQKWELPARLTTSEALNTTKRGCYGFTHKYRKAEGAQAMKEQTHNTDTHKVGGGTRYSESRFVFCSLTWE